MNIMSLSVKINYEADIDELLNENENFKILKDKILPTGSDMQWTRDGQREIRSNVIFIGKTGYGKSTTLNNIINKNIFKTDDIISCTKNLYEASYKLRNDRPHYLSLADLPGIGENIEVDKKYIEWYKEFFEYSDVVVYILRCDQRDFSIDEHLFKKLFSSNKEKEKVIFALNYMDKIEPLNRMTPFVLSEKQKINIEIKRNEVSKIFNVPHERIICYSAAEKFNIDILTRCICKNLKKNLNYKIVNAPLGVDEEAKKQIIYEQRIEKEVQALVAEVSKIAIGCIKGINKFISV